MVARLSQGLARARSVPLAAWLLLVKRRSQVDQVAELRGRRQVVDDVLEVETNVLQHILYL